MPTYKMIDLDQFAVIPKDRVKVLGVTVRFDKDQAKVAGFPVGQIMDRNVRRDLAYKVARDAATVCRMPDDGDSLVWLGTVTVVMPA